MPQPHSPLLPLVAIAVIVGCSAAAFAYTAGWLTPDRLTPNRFADAFRGPQGPAIGHRRNHAKGICFTGSFESTGAGSALSKAQVFTPGQYPILGRFSVATPDLAAVDGTQRVRGMAFRIATPDGQEWRTAMIDVPFFPVSRPEELYELTVASTSGDPKAVPAFAAGHPELARFGAWAKTAPWTGSYAEERYNGLNAFIFTDGSGAEHSVRWSLLPAEQPVSVPPDELAKRGPDFLEQEIQQRVANHPVRWTMNVTVANPGDQTADPNQPWPEDRRTVTVGTVTVAQIEPEPDGPCRDITFDPAVLPDGIKTSDDPFPAARSAVYAVSYDRRTAEANAYPHTPAGAKP
ncbi:MAG TPA: catalase family peroxidase [Rhodopila sp.]|nr:catalase family peroxidase [Rhodopila sp.]